MIVFYDERLVFLSVPKTGTTAWQRALLSRADIVISDPPQLKHAPVYRYNRWFRPMFDKVCGVDLELMAVMREPVSWLGSWYRYRQRPFLNGRPTSTAGRSFDEFVQGYMAEDRPPWADVGSQAAFLEQRKNGTGVSHLFRYEDQSAIRTFLGDRLKMTVPQPEACNVSPVADLHLPAATEARLHEVCAADFAVYDAIA